MGSLNRVLLALTLAGVQASATAGLFEDDEARRAILDLRQRVELLKADIDRTLAAADSQSASLGSGLLDMQRKVESLRSEMSALRGVNEQLQKELADIQKIQRDQQQVFAEKLARFEPVKVNVDGLEFLVEPAEKRDYEAALAVFKRGEFAAAQGLFVNFLNRFPSSGYYAVALFWLGNAQYATRDYNEAIANFRSLIAKSPDHPRAPEAVLSIANCQLELKDSKSARKTLTDLIKAYPQSEAAVAAKERLLSLK